MFERKKFTPQEVQEFGARFDVAKGYWTRAVSEGRLIRSEFFTEVFNSPQTEIYRECVNGETLLYIAKTLNDTWAGSDNGFNDVRKGLPASTASPTSTAARETPARRKPGA